MAFLIHGTLEESQQDYADGNLKQSYKGTSQQSHAEGDLNGKDPEDPKPIYAECDLLQQQDEESWKEVADYVSSRLGKQYEENDQATEFMLAQFRFACLSASFNHSKADSFSWAAKPVNSRRRKKSWNCYSAAS